MTRKNRVNVGDRINNLEVLKLDHINSNYQRFWLCRCHTCGNKKVIRQVCLTRQNKNKTCGCKAPGKQGRYIATKTGWKVTANKIYTKRYSDGNISFEEFVRLSQQPCFYCGQSQQSRFNPYLKLDGTIREDQRVTQKRIDEMWWSYNGLDRIDNSLPHNKNNCVTCCFRCNMMRRTQEQRDFIEQCKKIAQYNLISPLDVKKV